MTQLIVAAVAVLFCISNAHAQFGVHPMMPYDSSLIGHDAKGNEVPTAVSAQLDPNVQGEEYTFQFFVKEGDTNRVIYTQTVTDQWWIWVPLRELTKTPHTQLAITVKLRTAFGGSPFYVTKIFPAEQAQPRPLFRMSERINGGLTNYLYQRIIGGYSGGDIFLWSFPNRATKIEFMALAPSGDTMARKLVTGNPYIESNAAIDLQLYTNVWPGSVRLRGRVEYDGGPAGGYTYDRIVPDTMPPFWVDASAGWGPFQLGRDVANTFTVKYLGPLCDSVQWLVRYQTGNGVYRTLYDTSYAMNPRQDTSSISLNMRDLFRGAQLTVRAYFGKYVAPQERTYDIDIVNRPPVFMYSGLLPVVPGQNVVDTITIDSLPPKILNLSMVLTSGSGSHLAQTTTKRLTPAYIRSGKITFNRKDLSLGTYVVRVRAINEYKDDAPDYFFGFDVRDTSKFFLIADSWGPHTQGDSATITPGVTDVRAYPGPSGWQKIVGRFILVDSMNPTVVLYRSPDIDLSKVTSRDSVIYWPDSTYQFGKQIGNRIRIQTINLPLTAQVRFERVVVYQGSEQIDNSLSHPVYIVPSPGRLTATPRLDSAFVVTTNAPLKLRLDDIIPDASGVRFSLRGMGDRDPVIEEVVPVPPGKNSVEWSADAGLLPVNSKLTVTLATNLTDDVGSEITRVINTTPDTLHMVAVPPIDTLFLDWDIDPVTRMILRVGRLTSTLTFSKIPAQTRSIVIISYNDEGQVIDSIQVPVPYRLKYDPNLVVATPFTFRAFNTAGIEYRYLSDGGPEGGVRYRRNIATRFVTPFEAVVRKMDFTQSPPRVDPSPILQGSNDIVDMSLRWRSNSSNSNVGYSNDLSVDSVLLEITDCAGNTVARHRIRPVSPQTNSGNAADTLYPVSKLPLSTTGITYRIYSRSLTLPSTGVTLRAPISLRTAPLLLIPYGTSYPSFRVTDTLNATLSQSLRITNLNGVVRIDSIGIYNRKGQKVVGLGSYSVNADTIGITSFDANQLIPEDGPYAVIGTVHTQTCLRSGTLVDTLAVLSTPRIAPDPNTKNWIYSSMGWGPFQQGRAPSSQIVANFDPSAIINNRAPVSDSIELSLVGYSRRLGVFTKETPVGFSYPKASPLPASARCRVTMNFTPFDTSSSVALHVKWFQRSIAGVAKVRDTMFLYPVSMIEFPDQIIEAETEGYEQSVLAGTPGVNVMQSIYDFRMVPKSTSISLLTFRMLSTSDHLLDTLAIVPDSRNTADTTSIFTMKRDVAQYPWPYIARERDDVQIQIGYQFEGSTRPTKIQKTGIRILPRAEWLNGSTANLDGAATETAIPIKVNIPMPSTKYDVTVPLFGASTHGVEGENGFSTDLVVKAIYNPTTKQFAMNGQTSGGSFWVPTVSLFGINYNVKNISRDGQKSGEFEALYRFEEAPLADDSDTIPNRELRIRSLYQAGGGGIGQMLHWIKEMKETIERIVKTGSLLASGGLVEFTPVFVVDGSAQQVSTINIGTEEKGALLHLREEETVDAKTEQNAFPTSQGIGVTLTGGGGVDASLLGLIGIGVTCTNDFLFASGSLFQNSIYERESEFYPTTLNYSAWLNVELSLFFGIVNVDLYRGRLYYKNSPQLMPSFSVFREGYESIFGTARTKESERTQVLRQLARIPEETPYYRPAPKIAANNSALVTVHVEQSLMSGTGRIVLSSLDTVTHSLRPTAVIADNRNGIHDPFVDICGNSGSALVAWLQNDYTATNVLSIASPAELLRTENVHVAFYDASSTSIQQLPLLADASRELIDGRPAIATGADTNSAMVAWPAMADDYAYTDVYVRPLRRIDGKWLALETIRLVRMPGIDRDVEIEPLDDGTYLLAWINNDVAAGSTRVVTAILSPDGKVTTQTLAIAPSNTVIANFDMVGNGRDAVLFFGKSMSEGVVEHAKSLDVYRFKNGAWASNPQRFDLGGDRGVFRHIKADIDGSGEFFIVVDLINHKETGPAEHIVAACQGSVDTPPSQWAVNVNSSVLTESDKSVWSMETVIGPNNTYYVATQELDTLRSNKQVYRYGLQLGPARCNAVLRAVRRDGQNGLATVPFGNTPVSVDDSEADKLEAALRYRMKVLDPAPNPAREACVVPLYVERPSTITMHIADAFGNTVATVFRGTVETGIQGVSFELSELSSGHYTVVVTDEIGLVGSVPLVVVK